MNTLLFIVVYSESLRGKTKELKLINQEKSIESTKNLEYVYCVSCVEWQDPPPNKKVLPWVWY